MCERSCWATQVLSHVAGSSCRSPSAVFGVNVQDVGVRLQTRATHGTVRVCASKLGEQKTKAMLWVACFQHLSRNKRRSK